MHDLIIVGGGPAALAGAIYALGKQLDLLLIYDRPEGQAGAHQRLVGQTGEQRLPGEATVQEFRREVLRSGHALRDRVTSVVKRGTSFGVETERRGAFKALAVLVATGAAPIKLEVPGAEEFLGQGLGYSATTHAPLIAGKTAAVIGATERALRGAAELAQTAVQVYLVPHTMPGLATPLGHMLAQLPNVELLAGYRVREVTGGFNVEEVVVERAGTVRRLGVDAAFIDLGLTPNSAPVKHLVATDPAGFITVDAHNATSVPGLFAAGDVTTAFGEQTLIAIGDGARAAWNAYAYVLLRRLIYQRQASQAA
jgi:thioredoxin reductase